MNTQDKNITHNSMLLDQAELKESYIRNICNRGDLAYTTIHEQTLIIEEMLKSEIGTFILKNKGANGFWTDIMMNCLNNKEALESAKSNSFEDFLLFRSPVVLAHRERFQIFKTTIQNALRPGFSLASLPCGLMRDLLSIDYSESPRCKLTGIDIDPNSLELAANLANSMGIKNELYFRQQNAWDLEYDNEFDIITSSGLNVYEPSRNRTVELYKLFLQALKPGGMLVTSVLTFPPFSETPTDWDLSLIPKEDLRLERIIHHDILNVKWGNFRSSDDLTTDFISAGFKKVEVIMDSRKIFPTVIAYK